MHIAQSTFSHPMKRIMRNAIIQLVLGVALALTGRADDAITGKPPRGGEVSDSTIARKITLLKAEKAGLADKYNNLFRQEQSRYEGAIAALEMLLRELAAVSDTGAVDSTADHGGSK